MKDVIATSWTKQNGQWVAWDGQTRIMNGWVLYKDELYYIKDGFMLEDQLADIYGETYLFGKDGRCLYRWQKVNGKWAYFYFDDGQRQDCHRQGWQALLPRQRRLPNDQLRCSIRC